MFCAAPPAARAAVLVREERADLALSAIASAAYESLDVASFRQMLMLASDAELQQFASSTHPEWVLENGRVVFAAPVTAKSERVPATRLIKENLAYATELERIV